MDAIVTAGGIPQPEDPLYTYSHGDSKALIDIAGKHMIQWVLDALSDAKLVDNVIVIGLSPKSGVSCKKPLHFLSNQGRMLSNIVAGVNKSLELNKKNKYVLIVSSDIPALRPEMVDWLIENCMTTKDELYYGICPKDVMETRFPDSRRTYTKLKGMELCGADMHVSHVSMATDHLDMWEQLIGNRKSPLRQASIIGLGTFFKVLTRTITLDDLVATVSKRIGIKGRAIYFPFAEPCMDVDKPHQLELLREDLEKETGETCRKKKGTCCEIETCQKTCCGQIDESEDREKMTVNTILEFDARLSEKMRVAEQPGALRAIAVFFAHSGDSWFWGLALIVAWLFSDSNWKRWEVVELVGIGGLAALVLGIKFLVRRKRPEGEWGSIYRNTDPHSFPSGHAARAFLIAVVASALAPAWLSILLWIWAPLVALARVAMGVHYVSDVVAGTILGVVVAWIGLQMYEPALMWVSGVIQIPLW